MSVLDASAVLALMHDEVGADIVAAEIASTSLGTANLAEVVGKLVDAGVDVSRVREVLSAAGVTIEPVRTQNLRERCSRSRVAGTSRSETAAVWR